MDFSRFVGGFTGFELQKPMYCGVNFLIVTECGPIQEWTIRF